MFRQPIKTLRQGDRAGICVTQFDPKLLERGLVSLPGQLSTIHGCIVDVHRIPHYKGTCTNKSKFHVTIGYETTMATLQFFQPVVNGDLDLVNGIDNSATFDFNAEYEFADELSPETAVLCGGAGKRRQFVILEFESPIICPLDSLLIGSRLDADVNTTSCRLAFHGKWFVWQK